MVITISIVSLGLPILLSAICIWVASAIIWMLLPHHKSDFKGFPDEDATRNALLPQDLAPGQYDIPHLTSRGELKKPEVIKKFEEGPAGFFTIVPKGVLKIGKGMILSLLYYIVIGIFVADIAIRTLYPSGESIEVFRVTGTVAWLAYGWGIVPEAIWFGRPWSAIIKHLIDTFIYAIITAIIFSWLWS